MQFIFQFCLKNIKGAKCILLKGLLLGSFQIFQHFSQNNQVQTSLFLKKRINKAFNMFFFNQITLCYKKRKQPLNKNYRCFLNNSVF